MTSIEFINKQINEHYTLLQEALDKGDDKEAEKLFRVCEDYTDMLSH